MAVTVDYHAHDYTHLSKISIKVLQASVQPFVSVVAIIVNYPFLIAVGFTFLLYIP